MPNPRSLGTDLLGSVYLGFWRVAMFNAHWQGWSRATSETKPWHKGETPTRPSPHGRPWLWEAGGDGVSRGISRAPLTQSPRLCW